MCLFFAQIVPTDTGSGDFIYGSIMSMVILGLNNKISSVDLVSAHPAYTHRIECCLCRLLHKSSSAPLDLSGVNIDLISSLIPPLT